ncbi:MAG: hypothetical protein AAF939_13860 [Planctomycetota bacterium]
MIPENYQEWRYCIETLGEVELTAAYVNQRLSILQDNQNAETKKFAKLYGEDHLRRTVDWFRRAQNELPSR